MTVVQKRGRGRPRISDEERRIRAEVLVRPGDMARLRAAAAKRGLPTGRLISDLVALVLEEPGPTARGVLASLLIDLGLDGSVDDESSRGARQGGREGRHQGPRKPQDGAAPSRAS